MASSGRCYNPFCEELKPIRFRNGWRLNSGAYASLCDKCGSAYEEGQFCETFHLKEQGWRVCDTCDKNIHCGCIVSLPSQAFLDIGGVECVDCRRKANVIVSAMAVDPNVFLEANKTCQSVIDEPEAKFLKTNQRKRKRNQVAPLTKDELHTSKDPINQTLTIKEVLGFLQPASNNKPSLSIIDGFEFEEYEDPPIIWDASLAVTNSAEPLCSEAQASTVKQPDYPLNIGAAELNGLHFPFYTAQLAPRVPLIFPDAEDIEEFCGKVEESLRDNKEFIKSNHNLATANQDLRSSAETTQKKLEEELTRLRVEVYQLRIQGQKKDDEIAELRKIKKNLEDHLLRVKEISAKEFNLIHKENGRLRDQNVFLESKEYKRQLVHTYQHSLEYNKVLEELALCCCVLGFHRGVAATKAKFPQHEDVHIPCMLQARWDEIEKRRTRNSEPPFFPPSNLVATEELDWLH